MKLNHCHSLACAQMVEALTAKVNAYMEMMDANVKEMDRLMTKKWVGLTDEEIAMIHADYPNPQGFAKAIIAKLKEKNT